MDPGEASPTVFNQDWDHLSSRIARHWLARQGDSVSMGIPSVSLLFFSRSSADRNAILLRHFRAAPALLFVHSILDIIKVESATPMRLLYNSQLSHWDGDHKALMNLRESAGHSHTSLPSQNDWQKVPRAADTKVCSYEGLRMPTLP